MNTSGNFRFLPEKPDFIKGDTMSKEYPLYDEHADRWYRWDGNCKEFEPDTVFIHGKPERKTQPPQVEEIRYCPLRTHRPRCNSNCVLYSGDGCKIAVKPADTDTAGKTCLFDSYTCNSSCALYHDGCTLIHHFEKGL